MASTTFDIRKFVVNVQNKWGLTDNDVEWALLSYAHKKEMLHEAARYANRR